MKKSEDVDSGMKTCGLAVWLTMWAAACAILFVCSTGCTPAEAAAALLTDLATAVGQMGDQVDVLTDTMGQVTP